MSIPSAIGQSLRRVDGGEKVTGLTRYAAALALPGMVHVRLVLSLYPHAHIARIDTKAAAEVPGVLGAFSARDLKLAKVDPTARSKSPLAVDRALFGLPAQERSRPGDPMVTGQPWPKMGMRECLERLKVERLRCAG